MTTNDNVNHPAHYNSGSIEVIKFIEDQLTPEEFAGFCKGNVLKYIPRERHKGGIEDIKKALDYLERLAKAKEKLGEEKTKTIVLNKKPGSSFFQIMLAMTYFERKGMEIYPYKVTNYCDGVKRYKKMARGSLITDDEYAYFKVDPCAETFETNDVEKTNEKYQAVTLDDIRTDKDLISSLYCTYSCFYKIATIPADCHYIINRDSNGVETLVYSKSPIETY